MQLQQRLLELFSKKVASTIKSITGSPKKAKDFNANLMDQVISEQLLSRNARIEQGVEKNKKLSIEFVDWIIIEYNLKAAEKIDSKSAEVLNKVVAQLKERGVALNEEEINSKIAERKI